MKKLFACLLFALCAGAAQASMMWTAIAVTPAELQQFRSSRELLERAFLSKGADLIDLDKAWHGIHFLLAGTAWEAKGTAGRAILGGREFGPDLGYGPPRVLSPAEVKRVAAALANVTPEMLASRYDVEAMEKADIYPSIWRREGREALEYLLHYYKPLVEFYQRAAARGRAVIIAVV